MSREQLLRALARTGVSEGYINVAGSYVATPTETLRLVAPHFIGPRNESAGEPMVCTPGRYHPDLYGTLIKANGHACRAVGYVNEPGYHILYTDAGQRRMVIAAPETLPTPARSWGWQVQLYAARSRESWGIGDFRDLGLICRIAASQGATCVQVSPVHAMAPISKPQDSPYSPASRCYLNLLHVAPGLAPGAELVDISDLAAAGRALNSERMIDRAAVWKLKREALWRIFSAAEPPAEFAAWREAQGASLERFATWSVIAETLDTPKWSIWPEELRRPDSKAVRQYAADKAEQVAFHCWCQWTAALQYAIACSSGVDVLADLAVGFDADSEEAWAYQDQIALDFEIGAPPDAHNVDGQRWGLPPFNPQLLQDDDFKAFIGVVRSALAYAGALRIDHVMQLWRLYWVPRELTADKGVYVYYPVDALLAVLRVEAARRGAWIVGEDMGTVAQGVRETMRDIGMLGNRSAMRTPVAEFPELGVGTSSTHDQVTVAGLLTGSDMDDLVRIGKPTDFAAMANTRRGLAELAHLDPDKPECAITEEDTHIAVMARYRLLAEAQSRVVVVSLDDAAMVRERPNMPGTVDTYPNWRLALPRPVDEVMGSALAGDLVALMNRRR